MVQINWDSTGNRLFETGVDRGVLYVGTNPGVFWPGLISVSEEPSGGDATGYYLDGVKYLNVAASSEFAGSIEAFSSPSEFGVCEGLSTLNGLSFMDQPKKMFGLSYRTKLGNDVSGTEYAYKLHLIYNALAGTPSKQYSTLSDSPSPISFSWPVTAKPVTIAGRKPTAHLIVDSSKTTSGRMTSLENILYGTSSTNPRLPTAAELITLFT